jgi:hypothetical protein
VLLPPHTIGYRDPFRPRAISALYARLWRRLDPWACFPTFPRARYNLDKAAEHILTSEIFSGQIILEYARKRLPIMARKHSRVHCLYELRDPLFPYRVQTGYAADDRV